MHPQQSWDEFARAAAHRRWTSSSRCATTRGRSRPVWLGHPTTAHWGFPDPSRVDGGEDAKRAAFHRVFADIRKHIEALIDLPESDFRARTIARCARTHSRFRAERARIFAPFDGGILGTATLLAVVADSGIMGERLATRLIALLANSPATAGGLFVLISIFAPLSRRALQSAGEHRASVVAGRQCTAHCNVCCGANRRRARGRADRTRDVDVPLLQASDQSAYWRSAMDCRSAWRSFWVAAGDRFERKGNRAYSLRRALLAISVRLIGSRPRHRSPIQPVTWRAHSPVHLLGIRIDDVPMFVLAQWRGRRVA